jgi:hypothetical protein
VILGDLRNPDAAALVGRLTIADVGNGTREPASRAGNREAYIMHGLIGE